MRDAYCSHCREQLEWHGGFPSVPPTARAPRSTFTFWMMAWLGIVAAGGMFGLFFGCIAGLIAGCTIAGIFGIPIVATTAVLSWVFWLSRFRVAVSCLAGCLTGVMATLSLLEPLGAIAFNNPGSFTPVLGAGFLGMVGSGVAGSLYWRRGPTGKDTLASRWQFSLGDLFLRMTVVSVLFAAWLALFRVLNGNFLIQ